ncbi:Site-specific DNA recombinase related to the DNA invertase Pin [Nostoc flagelliforme CCNUN1]|uniref:Site-specific DNA recombinase related to the DNA invertase Pin n=1 Tax=Nostoc flagelliforme CCNUN1 TaxID=2038116 RepID=A0A2K8SYS3_9NOSO|nr:recombinase family protein [Nostoc flagelliforme]AUB40540.1 Site-specific DNA recombinase related to the DNA invertase Pin [Nostoc flagelliforme CCNUN1]
MKIAGYARLSTREQARGQTLEQQIDRLKKAGATEIYHDLESGRKDSREQFQKLISDAEANKISKIICTRVDRFSRNMVTTVSTAKKLFEQYRVTLLFLDDPDMNLDSSDGLFMFTLKASLAQRESDQISERVRHGKEYQRANGLAVSTKPPYGYIINKQRKYELDKRPTLCLLSQRPDNYLFNKEYYSEL